MLSMVDKFAFIISSKMLYFVASIIMIGTMILIYSWLYHQKYDQQLRIGEVYFRISDVDIPQFSFLVFNDGPTTISSILVRLECDGHGHLGHITEFDVLSSEPVSSDILRNAEHRASLRSGENAKYYVKAPFASIASSCKISVVSGESTWSRRQ